VTPPKLLTLTNLCIGLLGLASVSFFSQSANARALSFECRSVQGVPTTVALMSSGKTINIIRWKSNDFASDGWSPARRCEAVSERMTANKDRLRFLATGQMNGMNVICAALSHGSPCENLIYTLKPGQNPGATLRRLVFVNSHATSPLSETNGQTYVDMNQILGLGDSSDQPVMNSGDKLNQW
jgi:hypothetical protein